MICPRHEETRKVAAIVRQRLKTEGAIGAADHVVIVLRRMDLGSESYRDLLHYAPGRVIGFHTRTSGGFKPGERWKVRETNCETVTLERDGKIRQFKPSAKAKWDVLVPSTMRRNAKSGIKRLPADAGRGPSYLSRFGLCTRLLPRRRGCCGLQREKQAAIPKCCIPRPFF
jgi:hypothetical protein